VFRRDLWEDEPIHRKFLTSYEEPKKSGVIVLEKPS
jgi:hypothetical protein